MNRTLKIAMSVGIVVAAAGFLLVSAGADAEYYKHVDELMAEPAAWEQKHLRVHGFVKAGSINEAIVERKTTRTFLLEYNGQVIEVRNEGPKPDTFRDEAEVVAKGHLVKENGTYVFDATELSAKCPSKYEGGTRTKEYGQPPLPNAGVNAGVSASNLP